MGSWSHSEINLLFWFPFLDHLYPSTPPLPFYKLVTGGVRKGWLWKCSLTGLLCALSTAQGFLISRLFCSVISPGGRRASFSRTDPCCKQVTSDGGLLLHSEASDIPRCWSKMQMGGHAFTAPQFVFFWPLEETVFYLMIECMVSHGHGWFSPFIVAIAKRVSLWEQQLIFSECYYSFSRISISPLHPHLYFPFTYA